MMDWNHALTFDSRRRAPGCYRHDGAGNTGDHFTFYIGMAAAMFAGPALRSSGISGLWTCRRLQQEGYPSFAAPFWGYLLIGVLLLWPQLTLGLAALLLGVGLVLAALAAGNMRLT